MPIVMGTLFIVLLAAAILQGAYLHRKLYPFVPVHVGTGEESTTMFKRVNHLTTFEFELQYGWDQLWPHAWAAAGVYLVSVFWCWAFWQYQWSWPGLLAQAPIELLVCIYAATAIPPILWLANFFARFQELDTGVVVGKLALGLILTTLPGWWPAIALWIPGFGLLRLWQMVRKTGPYEPQ